MNNWVTRYLILFLIAGFFSAGFASHVAFAASILQDSSAYRTTDTVYVTVIDATANLSALALDTVDIDAFSDTDAGGIMRTLVETDINTGIFTGTFGLTPGSSTSATLQVTVGDSLTVSYVSLDSVTSIVAGVTGIINIDGVSAGTEWNSGEEIPVFLIDPDANSNPTLDEDLDIFRTFNTANLDFSLIPTLTTGNPFTLENLLAVQVGPTLFTVVEVQDISQRAILKVNSPITFSTGDKLGFLLSDTFSDLYTTIYDPAGSFSGNNYFNYDVRYLPFNVTGGTIDSVDIRVVSLPPGGSVVTLATGAPLQGLINLADATGDDIFGIAGNDTISINFTLNTSGTPSMGPGNRIPVVADFFSYGIFGDGVTSAQRIANQIIRFELEETGNNTSVFAGTAEYVMVNQLNVLSRTFMDSAIVPIGVSPKFVVLEGSTGVNAPVIRYNDLDNFGVHTPIFDLQDAPSHSGAPAFDFTSYNPLDTAMVTLGDQDLNTDNDLIDIYTVVNPFPTLDPASDTVGVAGLPVLSGGPLYGNMLEIYFEDGSGPSRWISGILGPCGVAGTPDDGLFSTGFTLVESSTGSGIFTGDFQIPSTYCDGNTATIKSSSVLGTSIVAAYTDFRDSSNAINTLGIAALIGSSSIVLDSEQYEVNTGGVVTVIDFLANLSPVIVDTVSVLMNSTTDSTGFSVILTETNVNSGTFVSPQIIFSSAATNAAQLILRAPAGSIVYANYIQTDSALIVPAAGASGTPDALRFDPSDLYVQEGSGLLKVIDANAVPNTASRDTIMVHVSSVGSPGGFDVPLLEDTATSRTFTTTQAITFTLGSSVAPNRLHVNDPSDTVTATYSSFTPATATIVRPFSPPIETGIPDPAVDIGCSVDTDNDGLCDDMEDQGTHPGFLLIEHPTAGFTYEYGGATCKPLIDDQSVIEGGPEDIAYGSLDDVPACPDINTRDIYIEIDYMTNHKPDASALAQVVRAFESAPDPDGSGPILPGIKLHLQVDEDIAFHQVSIPQNDVAPFDAANPHGGYFQIKQEKFRTAEERSGSLGDKQLILETKRQAFHYALFGHNYNEAPGSSGWAEILGNDIMISLGEFERHVGSPSQQAGTLFHEIGHSISLDHSGNVETPRCNPNYISAMSYAFQFPTFVSDRPLDFSRSAMTQLTESSLKESLGFDRTSPPGLTAVYGGVTGGVALSPVKTTKTNDATMGLVLDGSTLYITDPGNHRVRKITNAFGTTSTFPSTGPFPGTADGKFNSPEGVAVNSTHIIVADSGNNRIQIFLKSDLTFKKKTGTLGSGLGQFNSPEGVAVNGTHIIVADTGNDRLVRYSHKSLLSPIIVGSSGSGNGQFKSPWAVAFDGSGNLYVVDSGNNRIQKFAPNGVYLDQVGTRGSGPGQFISPREIAVSGNIVYVADTGNNRIQMFDVNTLDLVAYPSEFGIFGTATGQFFNSTEGVAVDGSFIYVADTGNKRVQKFGISNPFTWNSVYVPTGTSAFKVSVPVPVNFNRVAPSTETVSQKIHVLSGVSGCTVTDTPTTPITIYGINDWANINLKFRDSNYFSDGQTQDPAALHELTAGDINGQLSSTIIILNELIQALEPAEFSDQTAGFALQNSLNISLNNANNFVIADNLNSALALLQGTVQTDVNALPITLEAADKKIEILSALDNAITAIQSALEPAAVSQIYADDDSATTNQGVAVNISVLVNDGSDAGSTISILSFTQGTKGVVTNNGGGILKYTPNAGQFGADSFTYTISNGVGQTDSATVKIIIIPVAPSFALKWGSSGTTDGKFNSPTGIDTDSTGKVYVSDSGNNRIQKFSSTGTFDRKWGSSGTTDGKFNNPTGVDVDSTGKVYVSDSGNNRIQKFSSTGTFDRKWGSSGTGNGQFKIPNGIGIDLANKIYVADSDNNRIQKFSSTGTFDIKWGSSGTGNGQFKKPRVAAVDSAGNVYVTDSVNNRIQKFSSTGTFILQWGSSGTTDGKFKNPTGIDVDSAGNVYVVDTDNHRIQKFSSTGTFIVKWGSFGTGNGQFKNPIGIAVDSTGNVFIADTGNHRIQKFVP